jgi:tRNA-specific 2-thiouridylase
MAKVIVAMSGGVDSSLTAALLQEQGHEVIGVTMHLWNDEDGRLAESLCCSQEMAESARRVCHQLNIPYYVFNYQKEFRRYVIEYFLNEYTRGYTPNPCMECNREIKFRAMLKRVEALGFEYLATGHYARVHDAGPDADPLQGRYQLWRAADRSKDQSYMLYMLPQASLARIFFPIGNYSKAQVREMAAVRGLASADRAESQDICFVPDGDYRNLLREEAPESLLPGPIVDLAGREIGRHQGLPLYTIGQRRGLGLGGGEPLYVAAMDVERNALIVGPPEAILRRHCRIEQADSIAGQWPAETFDCLVQVRAHATAAPATVMVQAANRVQVEFHTEQRAITPGQTAVFYDGDRVIGGGRIARPEGL